MKYITTPLIHEETEAQEKIAQDQHAPAKSSRAWIWSHEVWFYSPLFYTTFHVVSSDKILGSH